MTPANSRLQRTASHFGRLCPAAAVARYADAPLASILLLPLAWPSGERVSWDLTRPPLKRQALGARTAMAVTVGLAQSNGATSPELRARWPKD